MENWVFLIIYNPTDWGVSGHGYLWVHLYLDNWSILEIKAEFSSFSLFFPCWLVLWLACVGHCMYIMYACVVYILFFKETSSIKKKKQSRADAYIPYRADREYFVFFPQLPAALIYNCGFILNTKLPGSIKVASLWWPVGCLIRMSSSVWLCLYYVISL